MKILEITQLDFTYRLGSEEQSTLRGVNLIVNEGEMVAIEGPSGSGKSTLLYLMGGLLRPQSGTVRILGEDIAKLSDDELAELRNKGIGFVFQQFHLLPRATVEDNIVLPAAYPAESSRIQRTDREKARGLAELFGLGERLRFRPNQLSGGQQQRVAIARALMRDPKLILADEPTGNLDSKNSQQIIELLRHQASEGRAVIIVTHDPEVSRHCDRVCRMRDGVLESSPPKESGDSDARQRAKGPRTMGRWLSYLGTLPSEALSNIGRNRVRSALTMLGIIIGVAAVLGMVTLGEFAKRKILEGYATLGVNSVIFRGDSNWRQRATDKSANAFTSFDWDRDLVNLPRIFPEIELMSPVMSNWHGSASFGGKFVENEIRVFGVSPEAFAIGQTPMLVGTPFNRIHLDNKNAVCVIGFEIAQRLFNQVHPIGQILQVSDNSRAYGCRVIGVMEHQTSNQEFLKPDMHVYIPYTFFQTVSDFWDSQIRNVMMQIKEGHDIEEVGDSIQAFFEQKYGSSGVFRVRGDSKLLAQMRRFLSIFTMMLATIALISLGVGGIGITNMMLVSVSERLKEIGLRKALGATDRSVRMQFLMEAVVVCSVAGAMGIFLGFVCYESIIFAVSKFVPSVKFEWVVQPGALFLSLISILGVGLLSGIVPALKAEKLQVIEALRSE